MSVAEVRAFNRFYTGVIGVLDRGYLDSPYSLTEVRVLFELAQEDSTQSDSARQGCTEVADLRRTLGLDAGYLSRMLTRFASDGLVAKEPSPSDGRRQVIRLTEQGRAAFARLDERSSKEIAALLTPVTEDDRHKLVAAMGTIREVLEQAPRSARYVLRPPRPGDLGWVLHRHGVRYAEEHGFDETFEALVAQVVADYAAHHDPAREAAWIAEVDGEPVGSILCVRDDDTTAKLRLLLLEPAARGSGIGSALVEECVRFARNAGYARMTLWTVDELHAARRIYQKAGFELAEEEPEHLFGRDLVGQTWSLDLFAQWDEAESGHQRERSTSPN
jgi:DNA-binding MarR family transcriptional regulator/GNAT superfamily N-acetyltransferase